MDERVIWAGTLIDGPGTCRKEMAPPSAASRSIRPGAAP